MVKNNKIEAGKFKQRKLKLWFYISFKNFLRKEWSDTYIILHQFSWVEAIIRHQRLRPACKESPTFCTTFKDQRWLLTSGGIFGVTRSKCFIETKNEIKTFRNCKPKKTTLILIKFYFFFLKMLEALDELQGK